MVVEQVYIESLIESLSRIGMNGETPREGYTRGAYSDEETAAHQFIKFEGEKLGLIARVDQIGNLFITTPGNNSGIIEIGSHLDTVPNGGLYDGGAGIIAGLAAINAAMKSGRLPKNTGLRLVVWRGEESATYSKPYKGSKGAFGESFDVDILRQRWSKNDNGDSLTLEEAVLSQGFDPSYFRNKTPTITPNQIDETIAHEELHIEQANKLENDGDDIGIVTSIRGHSRFYICLHGESAHSGAAPMGTRYRRDANLALAYILTAIDRLAGSYLSREKDLVQTTGVINSDSNYVHHRMLSGQGMTKVSDFAYFSLDIRSLDEIFLRNYVHEAIELIKTTAGSHGVDIDIDEKGHEKPEALSATVQNAIAEASRYLGYRYQFMPSGAGHDAAVVARQRKSDGNVIPTGMVFIPCVDGNSHSKAEYVWTEWLVKGANVLEESFYRQAA